MTEVTLTILSEIVDRLLNHWRDDSAVMGLYATRHQCQFLLKTDNYVQTVFIYIFGQFLQVHFLICIHSQTLLSQILTKILQDIPVYMYIRGFRNRGFRLLTNFDNFIVFQMSIFKT